MKNEQRRQAESMYLQSGLTKTQIAEQISVSRRTIYQWSLEGSWDKLRKSAQHMPAILAEKCCYLIGHFTDHLLSAESRDMPISKQEVDMLHKLTVTANKLKQGSTVSEAMQTFTLLLARMQCHDPELAELVAPHIQSFVRDRSKLSETAFLLDGFNPEGYLDNKEEDATERELDDQDHQALLAKMSGAKSTIQLGAAVPGSSPVQSAPAAPAPSAGKPGPSPQKPSAAPKNAQHATSAHQNKFASYRDRNKSLYTPSGYSRANPHAHTPSLSAFEAGSPLVAA